VGYRRGGAPAKCQCRKANIRIWTRGALWVGRGIMVLPFVVACFRFCTQCRRTDRLSGVAAISQRPARDLLDTVNTAMVPARGHSFVTTLPRGQSVPLGGFQPRTLRVMKLIWCYVLTTILNFLFLFSLYRFILTYDPGASRQPSLQASPRMGPQERPWPRGPHPTLRRHGRRVARGRRSPPSHCPHPHCPLPPFPPSRHVMRYLSVFSTHPNQNKPKSLALSLLLFF